MLETRSFNNYLNEQLNKFDNGLHSIKYIKTNSRILRCLVFLYINSIEISFVPNGNWEGASAGINLGFKNKIYCAIPEIRTRKNHSAANLLVSLVHESNHFMNRVGKDLKRAAASPKSLTEFFIKEEARCFTEQYYVSRDLFNLGLDCSYHDYCEEMKDYFPNNMENYVREMVFPGNFSYLEFYKSPDFINWYSYLFSLPFSPNLSHDPTYS